MRNGNANLGGLATGAALGLVAGLAIPHARKAIMQAPSALAGDWMDALAAEHRMVETAFHHLMSTSETEPGKRQALLTKIAYSLNKHAIEEENVIYPALAEMGHAELARHLVDDHGEVKTFIFELRRMPLDAPGWIHKVQEFFTHLQRHMTEEETEVFPMFRDELAAEENERLTRMLNWEGFKVA